MLHISNILAAAIELAARRPSHNDDSSDTGWVKLVVIAIFIVIWAFSALGAAMKKANQKRQTQVRTGPPITQQTPRAAVPAMRKAMPPKQQQQRRRAARPPPMTAVRPAAVPPAAYPMQTTAAAPPAVPARASSSRGRQGSSAAQSGAPALSATSVRNWMKPEVMQQQFVLTELFDPPMSDRPNG
jgi:hypothetical protein